jgi:Uma2 family endonuclease
MALPEYPHPSRSPAPWAEVVPDHGPATVNELLTLADDGYIHEVVEGVLVRAGGSGGKATKLGLHLGARLFDYVHGHRLGVVTGADGVYKFPEAETGLIPDAGFYGVEHARQIIDENKPVPFAPDLAVEVVSPDQTPRMMAAKTRTYLRAGTRLVWVVWPQAEHIDVWHPHVLTGPVRTLNISDTLDGEDVIPGFSYPVAELFRDPLAPEEPEE